MRAAASETPRIVGVANSPSPRRPSNCAKHLLFGLIRCGASGANFTLVGKDYYRCSRNRERGTCDNRTSVWVSVIEEAVLGTLQMPDAVESGCYPASRFLFGIPVSDGSRDGHSEALPVQPLNITPVHVPRS